MVEGINNKIKRIKRMAFGFRNFNNFRLKIITKKLLLTLTNSVKKFQEPYWFTLYLYKN